tara:strand:+ start:835 stop:1989 length:1155 start_codon:yes stop_codon:yes gene_type:complete
MLNLLRLSSQRFRKTGIIPRMNYSILVEETIVERTDYPLKKCQDIIGGKQIAVLGYGPQGRGQALNLRDNGFNVTVGVRKGPSWDKAIEDGWVEGDSLVPFETAAEKGDIVQYLLSDAAQIQQWPLLKQHLTPNKTLYFSHGFGLTFPEQTQIIPPPDIDVVVVAPKGSGLTVRNHFVNGGGINASYAVFQDVSGEAKDTALSLAFGIGCGHAFETTAQKEVYSDLTGERCVLMGLIQGAFKAQYEVLRENGHSRSEAYNETVEEALESLYPLISEQGMDWMFRNCSTTAQRGALDWAPKFEKAIKPVIEECYRDVINGTETARTIACNSNDTYRENLETELAFIERSELWEVGKQLRKLRPNNKKNNKTDNKIKEGFNHPCPS